MEKQEEQLMEKQDKPKTGSIIVAGLGPGGAEDITPAVTDALRQADAVVGYKYYLPFAEPYLRPDCERVDTGMRRERERAEIAFGLAGEGKRVVVISSGDAGIYGMAPLLYEMKRERQQAGGNSDIDINSDSDIDSDRDSASLQAADIPVTVLPGISAFQKAAALLGAPIGHDLCLISLSDLMTPWERIERRIKAAADGDFVTAVYNPKSRERYWQLYRLKELFLAVRSSDTPVGYVKQAGRKGQQVSITTLGDLDPEDIDMFTVVIIGNSQTYACDGRMVTPRGYYSETPAGGAPAKVGQPKVGQAIMTESFRTIARELKHPDVPPDYKWALLHAIHTTADFDMENILRADPGAVETLYNKVASGQITTIVTDVTMVVSGIRKGALERLGIKALCYLSDPRTAQMAAEEGITRTQAGIRLAAQEHPGALYAFGNAPTALMELCELVRRGKAHPAGIIAAPVGFVHVRESKHMVKPFAQIPKLIVEGRKGGSNLAATLCNAILTYDDAAQLKPGRDL